MHRPGRQHGNADALSRRSCDGDCVQCLKMIPDSDPKLTNERRLLEDLQDQLITINRTKKADHKNKPDNTPNLTKKGVKIKKRW